MSRIPASGRVARPHGPYDTERDAAYAARSLGGPARPGWSILSAEQNRHLLTGACQAAGVSLGAWDERILTWLAGFEDSTCAVVAGLMTRARAAGTLAAADVATVLDALDVAADYKRDRAATCPDCDASPADLCGTCEWRLTVADGYDALAERIREATQ
jgi:hypothetical protein